MLSGFLPADSNRERSKVRAQGSGQLRSWLGPGFLGLLLVGIVSAVLQGWPAVLLNARSSAPSPSVNKTPGAAFSASPLFDPTASPRPAIAASGSSFAGPSPGGGVTVI